MASRTAVARRHARSLGLAAVSFLSASVLIASPALSAADGPVDLGTATSFAVLAGAGITNTNATTITGDVGTFPTTTRSGFSSVTLIGTDHGGDAVTQGAKDDLVTAYDDAASRTPATPHVVELGGQTLLPGVYSGESFGLTGTLTLDAEGRSDAQFVFQMESTLITEVSSRVVLVNGANPCQVVWQVGSSATFKTGTDFVGDVLALTSITAQSGADFVGRLLARNGAVTLDNNTITNAACTDSDPDPTVSPSTAGPTPSGSLGLTTSPTAGSPSPDVRPDRGTATPVTSPAPGTSRRPRGGAAAEPLLPETGPFHGGIAFLGGLLLIVGYAVLYAGHVAAHPKGRHRPRTR